MTTSLTKFKMKQVSDGVGQTSSTLKCKFCDLTFPNSSHGRALLTKHIIKLRSKGHKFECDHCGKEYPTAASLASHVKRVHIHQGFSCSICEKVYRCRDDFKRHMAQKHEGKKIELKCKFCDKTFGSRSGVRRHTDIIHRNLRHKCDICQDEYVCKRSLNDHIAREHKNAAKQFKCDLCDRVFKSKSGVRSHVEREHNNFNRHEVQCHLCKLKVVNKWVLKNHIEKIHEGKRVKPTERAFACSKCDKTFLYKRNLAYHMKQAHDARQNFPCNVCDKVFHWKSAFKSHVDRIHLKTTQVKCDICDQICGDKSNLAWHIKFKHINWRPENCDTCEKSFTTRQELKKHIKSVHEEEKRDVECPHCNKKFTQANSRNRHIRQFHTNSSQ